MSEHVCKANTIDVYVELAGKERFHTNLMGRDADNQHPISAITGLQEVLDNIELRNNSYTKEEIDQMLDSNMIYKGSVTDYESLPIVNNKVGDVYNICSTGDNYVWTGNSWDKFSGISGVLDEYATKDYVDGSVKNAVNIIEDHLDVHYYNKKQIDEMIVGYDPVVLSNLLTYKGDIPTYKSLPVIGVEIGHLYTVEDEQRQYFWDGFGWQLVGIDSYTKLEIDQQLSEHIIRINNVQNKLDALEQSVTDSTDIIQDIQDELSQTIKYTSQNDVRFIQLENNEALTSVTTEGNNANLIVMSKLNVVDVGSDVAHLNLNTKDFVTINNNKIVATTEDIDVAVSSKVDKDSVYTKQEIDAKLSSLFTYKGSVKTQADLPDNANIGDTYNVEDTGANYAWNGTEWDKLSETIDLTPYLTKEEFNKELIDELKDVVRYSTFVTDGQQRKAIQLNNHDVISGIATDGTGHILAMLSKYDVADFGSPRLHTNINTSKIVTVNDTQAVLTDELLGLILASDKNIQIQKNQVTDPATGFKFYQYNLSVDLSHLSTTEELQQAQKQLQELIETKQDKGNYVEVQEDGSVQISDAITIKSDNSIIIKDGEREIVLQEALRNEELEAKISIINSRLDSLLETKANKEDVYTKQEIDEKDAYNVKWSTFTDANGNVRKKVVLDNDEVITGKGVNGGEYVIAMVSRYNVTDFGNKHLHTNINTQQIVTINDNQAVLTDKILDNIILPGDNVLINKKDLVDPETSFPFNAYEISADLQDYYTKEQVDEVHTEIQSSIDEIQKEATKNENQWHSISDVISSTK